MRSSPLNQIDENNVSKFERFEKQKIASSKKSRALIKKAFFFVMKNI